MKHFILLTTALFAFTLTPSAQEKGYNLIVNISGMKSNKGKVLVAVYNSAETFLKEKFRKKDVTINQLKSTVTFTNLPQGNYAVSVFHDENNNKQMDKSFIGIPKERFGTSNGARSVAGPPKYEDATFLLSQDSAISITIE